MTKFPIFKEVPTMLIRNAKDSAATADEVWQRHGKIDDVGQGPVSYTHLTLPTIRLE